MLIFVLHIMMVDGAILECDRGTVGQSSPLSPNHTYYVNPHSSADEEEEDKDDEDEEVLPYVLKYYRGYNILLPLV
jgi:hypothetical protein